MKNIKTLLICGLCFSHFLNAQVELPPLFKPTYTFEVSGEDPKESAQSLTEHRIFGEDNPSFLSLDQDKKIFLMNAPRVDHCGFLHFEGSAVSFETKIDPNGNETRFYEQPLKIDISCYPTPFPRCGTFRSTESASSGEYLMEQLQLLKAKCQAQLILDGKIQEHYEIHSPKGFMD